MTAVLNQPHYMNADAARQYLEMVRWPHGPVCPHCGSVSKDHYALQGAAHRPGLWKCRDCRKQFSVTVGTVFERSKIGLHDWLKAVYLICSSKKGCSSHQLQRTLDVQYKTAWFMSHRIREAMKQPGGLMGGGSAPVEADATYVGGKERNKHRSKRDPKNIGGVGKECVFTLVERGGNARSFHIPSVNVKNLKPVLESQLMTKKTRLMTDGERPLRALKPMVASHETVNHEAGEYVRGDVHTNTVEGYFSILKRGIVGVFHHVSAHHLHRYCAEFDFRYNNRTALGVDDEMRTDEALRGIGGKRLMYKTDHRTA